MMSDLPNFAARLRASISSSTGDPEFALPAALPAQDARSGSDAAFNALALELFALQFERNPAYRKICVARNTSPGSVEHWTQIPAVPAAAFKELELTCLPAAERTTVFHSSGTTGQRPSRHFHSAESLRVYEASLWPWFAAHLLPESLADLVLNVASDQAHGRRHDSAAPKRHNERRGSLRLFVPFCGHSKFRPASDDLPGSGVNRRESSASPPALDLVVLAPAPSRAPRSSLVHMFETVRRRLGFADSVFAGTIDTTGSWNLDLESAIAAFRIAEERNVVLLLLGTAFSLVHLLDRLAERNLRFALPPGSRMMETGGYKGRSRALSKSQFHALITERLAIPPSHIVCEYGMSELSSQAYDRRLPGVNIRHSTFNAQHSTVGRNRAFQFPPWARALVVSPETGLAAADGETGLLRVFDLANVFSVMAVQTEDLAIRHGDGFELLGRAELAEPRGCSLMALDA